MTSDKVQADYDRLDTIAAVFSHSAAATDELYQRIRNCTEDLLQGGWEGRGSAAFSAEMSGTIFPALQRLQQALEVAQKTTLDAGSALRTAEEQAAALFTATVINPSALAANAANGFPDVPGFIGDLFSGAGAELVDMLKGIGNIFVHPIDTAKGLWYGINHPGELWDAFKQPYVEDWENGHPGRAIGRGLMFVGTLVAGTKGLDKAAKALGITGKGAEAASVVGRVINATGRVLSPAEEATARLLVGEGRVVEVLAESTVKNVRTADFLVDGTRTELKTISNITSTDVSGAVARRTLDGAGQAPHILLDARGQATLTRELAERSIRRAYGADKASRIQEIRIIGQDFDITVPRVP